MEGKRKSEFIDSLFDAKKELKNESNQRSWESVNFGNVIIQIGEKKLSCRHEILSHHSEYFKSCTQPRWNIDTPDEKIVVKLTDDLVTFEHFSDLLAYLIDPFQFPLTDSNVIHIYDVAEKFSFQNIKKVCENYLSKTELNLEWSFFYAQSNSSILQEKAIDYFVHHKAEFLSDYRFKILDKLVLIKFIEMDAKIDNKIHEKVDTLLRSLKKTSLELIERRRTLPLDTREFLTNTLPDKITKILPSLNIYDWKT